MAVFSLEIWQELSRKEICLISAGVLGMLILTVPVNAPWRGLPLGLGDGVCLHLFFWLIPIFLFGIIWKMIREKKYRTALFLFLSAVFFHVPAEISAAGMFLLIPYLPLRHFLPEKWNRLLF